MSQIDELLDRRNFSESVDSILYARPRLTTLFFPMFAIAFFAALGWMAYIPFEQTVHARGDLRVAGDAVTMHATEEGRVASVAAREGAFVEKGAVLFRLDDAPARVELARLEAEIERAKQMIVLLESQRERARSRGAAEVGRIARDVARHRELFERGILPQQMVENLESERRARAEASRQELLALEGEAVAARQTLGRLESERARTLRMLDEQTIHAAESGVVTRLHVAAPGEFVQRGAPLAEITPRGRAMELEAVVAPHEIARVRPGLPARIELDAYPRRQFGAIDGHVAFIAPERGEDGYRVRIAIEKDSPALAGSTAAERIELRSGLSGSVAVISSRRPLYEVIAERLGWTRS